MCVCVCPQEVGETERMGATRGIYVSCRDTI